LIQRLPLILTAALVGGPAFCCLAQAAPVQWKLSEGGNGHWYEVRTSPDYPSTGLTWEAARLAAEGLGGYLATITSDQENDFVYFTAEANVEAYWIEDGAGNWQGPYLGGYQPGPPTQPEADPAAGWAWVTGELWDYTDWATGEPNNYNDNEHYLQYFWNPDYPDDEPAWNDVLMYDGVMSYMVEWVPEPSTILLAALGLLGLTVRGWRRKR